MKNKAQLKRMLDKRARRAKRKEAKPAERNPKLLGKPRMSAEELQRSLNSVGLEILETDNALIVRKIPGWIEPT